jgi:proton glutamate symport protein
MNGMNIFTMARWATFGLGLLVALLHWGASSQGWGIGADILSTSRWLFLAALIIWAYGMKSLNGWIIASIFIGAEIGLTFPTIAKDLDVLNKIFMKLIKSVIAPLVFGTLVVGIAGHSDMKQVGRMGWKALLYFEVVTTIALFIGLFFINVFPVGLGIEQNAEMLAEIPKTVPQNWKDIVLHTFPENIAKSVAEGQVLQIVVFSILFALGLVMVKEHHRRVMVDFCESLSEAMFKFTNIIMYFAPFGVGGAVAYTVANLGIDIFKNLFALVLVLYLALIVFLLCVLLPIALLIKLPIRPFIKAISEPVSIAFATASSEAALPSALSSLRKFGIPNKVVSFVLPTGYTFNLDGTTLYLSLAAIFVAQAAGIQLTLGQQIVMMLTLMLTSKGVAGVARASLVILAGTASQFGLPMWPIAAIFGIDALMDMARTSVNMIGNCLATVVIAKWEGEYPPKEGYVEEVV